MASFSRGQKVRVKADYQPGLSQLPERLTAEQAAGKTGIILISGIHIESMHKVSLFNGPRGDFYSWELEPA